MKDNEKGIYHFKWKGSVPLQGDVPYPHGGGCSGCRTLKVCNVCGTSIAGLGTAGRKPDSCTNGRCGNCHRYVCTPGGGDRPGHGYGDAYKRICPHGIDLYAPGAYCPDCAQAVAERE